MNVISKLTSGKNLSDHCESRMDKDPKKGVEDGLHTICSLPKCLKVSKRKPN